MTARGTTDLAAERAGRHPQRSRATPADFVLNPAARVLWRSHDVVQIELGSNAVLVEGVDADAIRGMLPARTAGEPPPGGTPVGGAALEALTESGYLWPAQPAEQLDDRRMRPPAPRLAAELTAMASRYGHGAADLLQARRRTAVALHGNGRTAAHLAALLAAAGVGRIHVVEDGPARLHHAVPGGICPNDEGHHFADAVAAAVHRAAPDADTTPLPMGERPDLVVLAVDEPIDSERRAALHARGCAHLVVRLSADHGVVGPLVIPGRSSCIRCADLHRRDRDPAWTALAVQLAAPRRHGPVSDVALATVIAGVAAAHALTYLDGADPPTVNGTVEMHLPDWRLRRRSWPYHGDCDCGAASAADA
ncbi:MAG TPA: hypothetical protein VGN35_13695 [Jatrophihabitantaceae bacterium]|jgi:bacteriocin biosynthesis cyclodehydratase domain-containing protein|nr:hypothetical protein [Jatrophihabitantaceae bacterium]